MAGGNAADFRAPYPKGEDSVVILSFGPFDIPDAAQTDEIIEEMTVPFGFKAVKAEISGLLLTDSTPSTTINLQDDTGTPQVLIADASVTAFAIGAGAVQDITIVKTITINAGAILRFTYTSASSDVATGLKLRIWVVPVH